MAVVVLHDTTTLFLYALTDTTICLRISHLSKMSYPPHHSYSLQYLWDNLVTCSLTLRLLATNELIAFAFS